MMKQHLSRPRHRLLALTLALALGGATLLAQDKTSQGYRPAKGFVPDEATAKAIAEAVLSPIYGKDLVAGERPLYAHLEKGVWRVQGTPTQSGVDMTGGAVVVWLSKSDGRILYLSHSR